jgi:hypothetical protein
MNRALALLPLRYRRLDGRPAIVPAPGFSPRALPASPAGRRIEADAPDNARPWPTGVKPRSRRLGSSLGTAARTLRRIAAKHRDGMLWPAARRAAREYCHSLFSRDGGRYRLEVLRPGASDVIAADTSEAVRSSEILPLLRRDFEVVEFKGYGGSLLHFLLGGIAGNFVVGDPTADALLGMLFEIEDGMIAAGELQHDFAAFAARPLAVA